MAIIAGAEPFFLPGNEHGILLVHGFTGSPAEMGMLGQCLQQAGYTVMAPRLCGHGTTVEEMAETRWPHWYSSVEDAYHLLRQHCSVISVVGMSMGGLLALKLAAEYPVHKVVSLCTPIYIQDKRLFWLPLYRLLQQFVPKKRKKYADVDPIYTIGYGATPLSSLSSLLKLIKHVKPLLPLLQMPMLLVQARHDHTVQPRSAEYLYEHCGSADKKLVWLPKSGHLAVVDCDRQQVFEEIIAFLAKEIHKKQG